MHPFVTAEQVDGYGYVRTSHAVEEQCVAAALAVDGIGRRWGDAPGGGGFTHAVRDFGDLKDRVHLDGNALELLRCFQRSDKTLQVGIGHVVGSPGN